MNITLAWFIVGTVLLALAIAACAVLWLINKSWCDWWKNVVYTILLVISAVLITNAFLTVLNQK